MASKILAVLCALVMLAVPAFAEEEEEEQVINPVYVTADLLNGRSLPTTKAKIEARFDFCDVLQPTGLWSKDLKWIEVEGGESGAVWVDLRFVSERLMPFTAVNENNGKVKIRSKPFGGGRVRGYLKNGRQVEIDQVVLGYGHCKRGWIDLEYLIEEVETI